MIILLMLAMFVKALTDKMFLWVHRLTRLDPCPILWKSTKPGRFPVQAMRFSTTLNHINNVKNRLDNVFRSALFDMPNVRELSQRFNLAIDEYISYSILPNWAKEKISIHRRHLMERINRDYLIALYILPSGEKIINWDSFDEETRQMIREGGELPIKTFWLKVDEKCDKNGIITRISTPTDKVFFDSATPSGSLIDYY
jgi:hypothetical protein